VLSRRRSRTCYADLDDQFQGMPAEGVGRAAAEATARRSGGGLPALVVEGGSGAVRRQGRPRGA
jgi:hypothetical protein